MTNNLITAILLETAYTARKTRSMTSSMPSRTGYAELLLRRSGCAGATRDPVMSRVITNARWALVSVGAISAQEEVICGVSDAAWLDPSDTAALATHHAAINAIRHRADALGVPSPV